MPLKPLSLFLPAWALTSCLDYCHDFLIGSPVAVGYEQSATNSPAELLQNTESQSILLDTLIQVSLENCIFKKCCYK